MTPQVDSIEDYPKLANLAPTLGGVLRCLGYTGPELASARIRRALELIVARTRAEIEAVERFLDGDDGAIDCVSGSTDRHAGVTAAFWIARDLGYVEHVCQSRSPRPKAFDLANLIGHSGADVLRLAFAFENEHDDAEGGGLAMRTLAAQLVEILLGADAAGASEDVGHVADLRAPESGLPAAAE